MATDERIQCGRCGRAVVPQLWVDDRRGAIYHPQAHHLCPLCGATLHVSGGGVNRSFLWLVFWLVVITAVTVVVFNFLVKYTR